MPLTIEVIPNDSGQSDRVKVSLNGRLDGTTSPQLEKTLEPVLAGNIRTLIFDLANLEFISSMGIRVMITSQKTLSPRNGSVLLINMKPQIQKVMEIINALPGLSVFRDVKEMDDYLALMQKKVIEENS